MASSSAAPAEGALAPAPVPVAAGTKRRREEARETETIPPSGLEAWAAQAAPTPGRTADVVARSAGGASTSHPAASPSAGAVVGAPDEAATASETPTAPPNGGTHASLGASLRAPSKRKMRCFRYGNYHRYYGYRVGETLEDHRVAHFRDEWFAGKRVMDIGCNEGLVGLSIAVRCKPAKMLGVDIDPHLVKKAREKLARLKRAAARQIRERREAASRVEVLDEKGKEPKKNETDPGPSDSGPDLNPDLKTETETVTETRLADAADALDAVSFARRNVLAPEDEKHGLKKLFARDSFDAVLCLSVTKWIQLNWGDAGLEKLFHDVHECLSPGGVFIVEPQPWRSYGRAFKKQTMPDETRKHFQNITLRPCMYAEFLKTTVGFESVTTLRNADMHDASEFDRTVLLCVKKKDP